MICKHCGHENLDDSIYCIKCGRLLEAKEETVEYKEFCTNCGYHNESKSAFCPQCGQELKKETKVETGGFYENTTSREYVPADNSPIILSIISLAISFVCCCIPFVTQIVSIILSISAMAKASAAMKSSNPGNAKTGLVLGIVSFVIALVLLLFMVLGTVAVLTDPEFLDMLNDFQNGTVY